MEGWVKLYRKLIDDPLWTSEPFTKGQAWVDLIAMANHTDERVYINGNWVEIKRGQLHTSELKLAARWRWSKNKVTRFLEVLRLDGMLDKICSKGGLTNGTTLTLVNYSIYQGSDTTVETTNDTTNGQRTIQRLEHKQEYKECKEVKNDIDKKKIKKEKVADKSAIKKENPIEERAKMLMNKIAEVGLQTYGKEMCREFYDYWTECSDNGKKMRFEKESVFDVKKRLARWNYNAKNKGQQTIVKPGRIEGPGKFSVGGFEVELGEKEYIDEDGKRRYLYECEGKYYDSKAKGWPAVPLTADRRPLPRMIWNAESKHWDSLF